MRRSVSCCSGVKSDSAGGGAASAWAAGGGVSVGTGIGGVDPRGIDGVDPKEIGGVDGVDGGVMPSIFTGSSFTRIIGLVSRKAISRPMPSEKAWPGTRNLRLTAQT